jgi:hypothetical protein
MAGINYPLWYTLKNNIVSALETIATEEALVSAARNFEVEKDRWRPWIESQQSVPLVNVMVQNVSPIAEQSGSKKSTMNQIIVMIDMYVMGKAGETLPVDTYAADRLDLLTAQVREGLTRLASFDFGMFDTDGDPLIEKGADLTLQIYDQENEQVTGQYAPARWSLTVNMPFIPTDDNSLLNLEEIGVQVKEDDLDVWAVEFAYTNTEE